ncbi:MAG: VOC family protein [Xanthomonadales bacterium]|nr:VOC family protein [Xanthomonadales bacterium]
MGEYKSAINWFEIPAMEFERAVRFYSDIFAYEIPTRDMGHIRMGFFEHQPGAGTGGAIVCGEHYIPSVTGTRVYLNAGEDLAVVLGRVEDAGGTVVMGKSQVSPEIGYIAVIEDTEGNRVYLHSMN